jgi:penicillin amidase
MKRVVRSPYGRIRIDEISAQCVRVQGPSDRACYFGQGYVAGCLRLWQMDLTRRVAAGELSAILGPATLATDRFQRNLGLRGLAVREAQRMAGTVEGGHVAAYVAGVNQAMADTTLPPLECVLLGYRPAPLMVEDVHLVAQLKYFINAAWQFELFHTFVSGRLETAQAAHLFATISDTGATFDPLARTGNDALADAVAAALAAGLAGLEHLGLSSPDIGSNAFAVGGGRSASGHPLLATDPHMGNVNPGFNLLFHLRSDEGLDVFGSSFPGAPGIIVGRNRHCGWGMTGIMADNQDLYVGQLNAAGTEVRVDGTWQALDHEHSTIAVRGQAPEPHLARGFSGGRLIHAADQRAVFLRWPALDQPVGGICLNALSRARDWPSFRSAVAELTNSPMMVVYADRAGDIGIQAIGHVPRRRHPVGSLLLSLDDPAHAWAGYIPFAELPHALNPPAGAIVNANQYDSGLFDGGPHLSTRWHPPSRAWRIHELLNARAKHDPASLMAIQDDRVDLFARSALPRLHAHMDQPTGLEHWTGDTRDAACATLFERWMHALLHRLLDPVLEAGLVDRYMDQWPAHRWNVLSMLDADVPAWRNQPVTALVRAAFADARALVAPIARVVYRHSLRRHPLGGLFSVSHAYAGGSRETVHVARRNADFLTASQGARDPAAFSFGPSFKLVFDFGPEASVDYLSNMPSRGNPLGWALRATLRRWQRGARYRLKLSDG